LSTDWRCSVCGFWFTLDYDQWFGTDPALDCRIKEQFLGIWTSKRELPAETFLDEPLTALAGVILFDQFPRNMFRGDAEQFATDPLALAIAKGAIERGLDATLTTDERAFLYMPFEHSEDQVDQDRSMLLFTALGDLRYLKFAKLHHDIIERFGRFPHRNAILGRSPREAETEAGNVVPW
jgi:uncharacterized protein (DUF924 family)